MMTPPRSVDRLATYVHPTRPLLRESVPVSVGAEPMPTLTRRGVQWPLLMVSATDDIPAPTRRAQEVGR